MILPLVVRHEAEQEFDAAITWYMEQASREWGHRFMSAVHHAFDEIQAHPEQFNFHRLGTRHYQLKPFPHDIHYLTESDRIVVIAVFHRRRDDISLSERL
ncbi:MAG: type II toxin-antitoxin system RelE/ParE family toxin [Roseimicrobium sp.]